MSLEKYARPGLFPLGGIAMISMAIVAVWAAPKAEMRSQDPQYANPAYASPAPAEVDFGKQAVGWAHQSKRVIVTNTGGKPLMIDSVAAGGDHSSEFSIVKDTCTGASIPPNRACVIDVSFSPRVAEDRRANLTFIDSAINSPQTVALKGTGINSHNIEPF